MEMFSPMKLNIVFIGVVLYWFICLIVVCLMVLLALCHPELAEGWFISLLVY
jgi:hypothetical protein